MGQYGSIAHHRFVGLWVKALWECREPRPRVPGGKGSESGLKKYFVGSKKSCIFAIAF